MDERPQLITGLRVVVALMFVAVVGRGLLFTAYRVEGTSMLQTLLDGDKILVADVDWLNHPVRNGDTVVVEFEDEVMVKRVVAGPGDVIAMDDGVVVRNGRRLREAIPRELNRSVSFPDYPMGDDELFLLGDNRRVSIDSRDFGPVRLGDVIGRVYLRIGEEGMGALSDLERMR